MRITVSQAKELRDRLRLLDFTDVGIMECRKALQKADGNIDGAIEKLRGTGAIIVDEQWSILADIHSQIESGLENFDELTFAEFNALVANVRMFPKMRKDEFEGAHSEYAVREKLYMTVLLDKSLQAAFQIFLLAEVSSKLGEVSSKSTFTGQQSEKSGSGAGQSNLARNVAMMGGIAALQKLNQIEENTEDISEGCGFD